MTDKIDPTLNMKALINKVNFISKVSKSIREFSKDTGIVDHPFLKEFIIQNKGMFNLINNEVKEVPKNRVNFDKLLGL